MTDEERSSKFKQIYEANKANYQEAQKKKHLVFIEAYAKNPKYCKTCNTQIPYESRANSYCNQSCYVQTLKGNKNRLDPSIPRSYTCEGCNKEFVPPYLSRKRKFCSPKCCGFSRRRDVFESIDRTGVVTSANTARRYLRYKCGEKCTICEITEWCGKVVPLVVDHINGNPEDNRVTNLRLVCGNCDMQLPTYKSKNKGNGRAYRRKRYKEGKSY